MRLISLFLLFAVSAWPFTGIHAEKIQIKLSDNLLNSVTCSSPAFVYDSVSAFSFNDIRQVPFKDYSATLLGDVKSHSSNDRLWIKFNIRNLSDHAAVNCFMHVGPFDFITAYIISNTVIDSVQSGTLCGTFNGDVYLYQLGFPLQLNAGAEKVVFIKINQASRYYQHASLELNLYDSNDFKNAIINNFYNHKPEVFMHILFNGIFLFQFIYILFQWFIVKRMEYFYYTCYIFTVLVHFIIRSLPDLAIQDLHAVFPAYLLYLNNAMIILPYFFYYRFGRFFIDMEGRLPGMNKWVMRFEFVIAAMVLMELLASLFEGFSWYRYYGGYMEIAILFMVSVVFLLSLSRDKNTLTRFLVAGSFVALSGSLLGMFAHQLFDLFKVDFYISPLTVSKAGVMLEMIIFNTGLLYKAREMEKEKIKAQESLIIELGENQKLQQKYQSVRDRIAGDLHDDVGATLSSINIFSRLAQEKLSQEPQQAKILIEKIHITSQEMMNSMSDMVWAISPGNDQSESLSLRIKNFAREMLAPQEINYVVQSGDEHHKFAMEARKNIFLIAKEAINNIAKYSQAKNVLIKLEERNGKLHLEIDDDGVGFSPSAFGAGSGGNPEIRESIRGGAGLASMKSRAEQMGGTLQVQSEPGAGTKIKALFDLDKINY